MTTFFVTHTKGFEEQEDAEEYARIQSLKTRKKFAVLVRDGEIGPTLSTVAIYSGGERTLRAEYVPD